MRILWFFWCLRFEPQTLHNIMHCPYQLNYTHRDFISYSFLEKKLHNITQLVLLEFVFVQNEEKAFGIIFQDERK